MNYITYIDFPFTDITVARVFELANLNYDEQS